MRAVLGIDAAWTLKQPSGVALAKETASGWELVAVEASYQRFLSLGIPGIEPELKPSGSTPDARLLLEAARNLGETSVGLVTIDMPLALTPITCRRESDNAVSRAYGGRLCGTHSPSDERPGPIGDRLREGFGNVGYPLHTTEISGQGVIEVYPHPALVELAGASERLKYKVANSRKYWPDLSPTERREGVLAEWSRIIGLLDPKIDGVAEAFEGFESGVSGAELKATEDALDAVVCAWVGICALNGEAVPYGDEDSAIWIPRPR